MIVVDTNVLSEPMRANGDPAVADWLDRQRPDALFLTTVTLAEVLPLGLPRSRLEARITEVINAFGERQILAFDTRVARVFAVSVARARAAGTPSALPMVRSPPLPPPMDLRSQHETSGHSLPPVSQ